MKRFVFVLLLAIAVLLLWHFGHLLRLNEIQMRRAELEYWVGSNPNLSAAIYFGLYVVIAALSLPGASLMTLLGGAFFGLGKGLVIVSFASSIGATMALLIARYFFREPIRRWLGEKAKRFDVVLTRDGLFYLLSLRLVPIFPFFLVNLAMGLSQIRVLPFFLVSQVGMLPGAFVYVNAGKQLWDLQSLSDVFSLNIFLAFLALASLPIAMKFVLRKVGLVDEKI